MLFLLEVTCVPPTFVGKKIGLFLKKIHFQIQQARFTSQMSLRIITEMFKNAPVLLKRFFSFWQIIPIYSGFSGYLNGDLFHCICKSGGKFLQTFISPTLNELNFDGQLASICEKEKLFPEQCCDKMRKSIRLLTYAPHVFWLQVFSRAAVQQTRIYKTVWKSKKHLHV